MHGENLKLKQHTSTLFIDTNNCIFKLISHHGLYT